MQTSWLSGLALSLSGLTKDITTLLSIAELDDAMLSGNSIVLNKNIACVQLSENDLNVIHDLREVSETVLRSNGASHQPKVANT